jgi:hypothetical protein
MAKNTINLINNNLWIKVISSQNRYSFPIFLKIFQKLYTGVLLKHSLKFWD